MQCRCCMAGPDDQARGRSHPIPVSARLVTIPPPRLPCAYKQRAPCTQGRRATEATPHGMLRPGQQLRPQCCVRIAARRDTYRRASPIAPTRCRVRRARPLRVLVPTVVTVTVGAEQVGNLGWPTPLPRTREAGTLGAAVEGKAKPRHGCCASCEWPRRIRLTVPFKPDRT
eukprot:366546-Chlamydomonas_euryale.AAC.12